MDLVWFYRYRRGGGESGFLDWELSTAPSSWESAPAPAQIGRRLIEAVFHRQIPVEHAALVNDVMVSPVPTLSEPENAVAIL